MTKDKNVSEQNGSIGQDSFTIYPIINAAWFIFFICLVIALAYLLFTTKSSPLFPFNDWVDANYYFTMGKGMMHGLVPYRDLFERKGPLLFFVYGIASLVSYRTFIGVYFIEVIAFSLFLFFSFKSLSLFMKKTIALSILPLLAIFVLNLKAFSHGGSAEELCLPLLAVSLYHLLRYLKNDDPSTATPGIFFWNGLIAGCVLWVKFSLLGFWLGWIITLFVSLIVRRPPQHALRGVTVFLCGMIVATVPWIIYFESNNAFGDWINTYFVVNLTSYPVNSSFSRHIYTIIRLLSIQIVNNPFFGLIFWWGIIGFAISKKFIKNIGNRIGLLLCILALIVGIYWGGMTHVYYYLILTPFIIFCLTVAVDAFNLLAKKVVTNRAAITLFAAVIIISLPLEYKFNQNAYMLHVRQSDLVQYKFAEIIDRSPDKTLLNYGWLDFGIYTTAGVLPPVKYFASTVLEYSRYPLEMDEQNRYVREGITKFVVLTDISPSINSEKFPLLNEAYHLVASGIQTYEGHMFTYSLFERMD